MRVVLQAFYARAAAAVPEHPHPPPAGQLELGGQVRERIQDEGALVHPGMGQRERRRRERQLAVEQDVQVERTRAPTRAGAPAMAQLERLELREQRLGLEPRLEA